MYTRNPATCVTLRKALSIALLKECSLNHRLVTEEKMTGRSKRVFSIVNKNESLWLT